MNEDAVVAQGETGLEERALRAERAVERLRAELEALSQREGFAGPEAQTLARLVETLRWEDGPRALRVVLPLARLFRRGSATVATPARSPVPRAPTAPVAAPPRRRLSRRILLAVYRLARPVALPLAIRLHRVLTRLLQREAILSHADPGPSMAVASATADLLRSMEAAMLTLALRPRGRDQDGAPGGRDTGGRDTGGRDTGERDAEAAQSRITEG